MAVEGHIIVTVDDSLEALKFYVVRISNATKAEEAVKKATELKTQHKASLDAQTIKKWENALSTFDGKSFPDGSFIEITTWLERPTTVG